MSSARWNNGPLDSYLIEITRDILGFKDPETGKPMVDLILDTAGQKGTGKWTVITACDLGVPSTLISEAVFARSLSAQKEERVAASGVLKCHTVPFTGNHQSMVDALEQALYAAKIDLLRPGLQPDEGHGWMSRNGKSTTEPWPYMWRGGCIIRSAFLGRIKQAFDRNPKLANLLLDPYFTGEITRAEESWRRICAAAITHGIALPGMTSGLSYFDGYRGENLPANLLQAQRDLFGCPHL